MAILANTLGKSVLFWDQYDLIQYKFLRINHLIVYDTATGFCFFLTKTRVQKTPLPLATNGHKGVGRILSNRPNIVKTIGSVLKRRPGNFNNSDRSLNQSCKSLRNHFISLTSYHVVSLSSNVLLIKGTLI